MQPIVWIKAHESVILVILVFASILIGFYVVIRKRSQALTAASEQQGAVAGATFAAQTSADNSLQYIPTVETWAIDNGTSGPISTTGSGTPEAGTPITTQTPLNPPVNSAPIQVGAPPLSTQVAVPLTTPDSGARTAPTNIVQMPASDVRVANPVTPIVQAPPVTGSVVTALPVVSLPIAPVVTPPHLIASSSTPIATPPHIIAPTPIKSVPVVAPTPIKSVPVVAPTPIKSAPIATPKKASVQWVQHYSSNNQTLNSIAHNATVSIASDMKKAGSGQSPTITGQQIYNQNKAVIDTAWAKKYDGKKGKVPSLDDPVYVTGVPIIIPKVVFS